MARKKLNKSLVVTLSLCAFVTMIVLSVIMLQRLAQRDPKYFIELAEQSAAEGQWRQAAVFYHQAAERANDPKYLVDAGEMMLREGDVQNARIAWTKALLQDPTLIEAHTRQLELLLKQAELYGANQDWQLVRDAAQSMLASVSDGAETAIAHYALGLATLRLGGREDGLEELRKARRLAPQKVDYATNLAAELVRLKKEDEAQALYDELMANHAQSGPSASKVRTAYAQYLTFRNKNDQAEAFFKEAIELAGDDVSALREARLAYADFLMQSWLNMRRTTPEAAQSVFDQAESIINQSLEGDPSSFDAYLQLARLYRLAQDHEKVVEVCERRIARGLDRKGVEATKNRLNAFTLMTFASESSVALAVLAGQRQDFAEREKWLLRAEQYVADARGEAATHPMVLSQSGRVKIARGQERDGLEDLRASDEAFRSYGRVNWENRIIRARLHLQLNEPGAARAVLEEVLTEATQTRPSDTNFWNVYAQVLVQSGELERAMNIVDRTLAIVPENRDAKRIKAAIFERQGKLAEAARWNPDDPDGVGTVRAILEARAATIEGDNETALQRLQVALEAEPSNPRIVAALASELAQIGRLDEARAVVGKARAADPNNDTFKAIELSLRPELTQEQRETELFEIIGAEQDGFKQALSYVALYTRKNDPAKTLEAIRKAESHFNARDTPSAKAATNVQMSALLRTKIRAGAQAGDERAMIEARDSAARLNIDGANGQSILGLYHFVRREYDLAIQAFQSVLVEQPTHVISLVLMGQSLQTLGRLDEARDAFTRAISVNPAEGLAHQGLAVIAQQTGDNVTLERELAICEKLIPNDAWVREQVLVRKEAANPAEAITRRERLLAQSEDPANLQRLAYLYELTGNNEKADKTYEKLLAMVSDDPRVAKAAAEYFRRRGNGGRSIEILRNFLSTRTSPEDRATAATMLAMEQFIQKDEKGAEKTLLEAAERGPTLELYFALVDLYQDRLQTPEKALPWIDKAIEIATRTNAPQLPVLFERRFACFLSREVDDLNRAREQAAAFRRQFPQDPRGFLLLSEVHARAGEIEQAVSALGDYLNKRPDDIYALTQRAQHNMARGKMADAIDDLERIKRTAPPASAIRARILLAHTYEREGRPDRALAELESLVNDVSGSPEALQELANAYIRRKRYADADRLATAMINRAGDAAANWLLLRGQVSLAQKDGVRALADFRRGAEATGYATSSVALVLGAYIELGRFDEGVQYYESLGSREEKDALILGAYAHLLARSGRTAQSVEVFRRAMTLMMATTGQPVQNIIQFVLAAFPAAEAAEPFEQTPCPPALSRANDRLLARLYALTPDRRPKAIAKMDVLIDSAMNDLEKAAFWYEKGEIHQVAGDHAAAVAAYEKSLAYHADSWMALNNVAYLLSEKGGRHDEALGFARKAVTLNDNPYSLDTLGWILVHLDRYDLAIAELSRAIRLDSDYAIAFYHLGEAYRRAGRFDEAAQVLESGLIPARTQQQTDLVQRMEEALAKARLRESSV